MKTFKQLHDDEQREALVAKWAKEMHDLEVQHWRNLQSIARGIAVFKVVLLASVVLTVAVFLYGLWRAAQ